MHLIVGQRDTVTTEINNQVRVITSKASDHKFASLKFLWSNILRHAKKKKFIRCNGNRKTPVKLSWPTCTHFLITSGDSLVTLYTNAWLHVEKSHLILVTHKSIRSACCSNREHIYTWFSQQLSKWDSKRTLNDSNSAHDVGSQAWRLVLDAWIFAHCLTAKSCWLTCTKQPLRRSICLHLCQTS